MLVLLLSGAFPQRGMAQAGRPIVVFLHGRAQAWKTANDMERDWYDAFDDGLDKVGPGLKEAIGPGDRRFVHYEWVYESDYQPRAAECGGVKPSSGVLLAARESRSVFAMEQANDAMATVMDSLAWDMSTPAGKIVDSTSAQMRMTTHSTVRAFDLAKKRLSAEESAKFDLMSLAMGILHAAVAKGFLPAGMASSFLDDTNAYLEKGPKSCDTDHTLLDALRAEKDRPIILVTHSMGAMVAYDILAPSSAGSTSLNIPLWLTLGSQLGVRSMPPLLIGGKATPPFPIPTQVADWVNFVGKADRLAFPTTGIFRSFTNSAMGVRDVVVDTGSNDSHSISRYLQLRDVASAIAAAWCKSFTAGKPPAACATVGN